VPIPAGLAIADLSFDLTGSAIDAHVILGVKPNGIAPAIVAAQLGDMFEPALKTAMTAETRFRNVTVVNASGQFGTSSRQSAGSNPGNSAPSNTAWLVTKTPGVGGRRKRGRMFIPGIPEGDVDPGGFIVPGRVEDLQDQFDTISEALAEPSPIANWDLCVIHSNGTHSVFDTFQVEGQVATQRRRMRR